MREPSAFPNQDSKEAIESEDEKKKMKINKIYPSTDCDDTKKDVHRIAPVTDDEMMYSKDDVKGTKLRISESVSSI